MLRGPASGVPSGGADVGRRIGRLFAVRRGEAPMVVPVVVAFAALEAGRGLGETGIRAVVLDALGAHVLPGLFVALGAAGIVVTLAVGAFLGPGRGAGVVLVVPSAAAVVVLLGWVASMGGRPLVTQALWVAVHLAGLLVLTLLWATAARAFDARQAKRLLPLCQSAATAGYLAGTLAAGPAARTIGTANLVLVQVGLLVAVGVAAARLRPHLRPGASRTAARTESGLAVIRSGAGFVGRSPLMRLVAVAYVLFAVLLFAMWFPYFAIMEEAFPDDAELAGALGLVAAAATAISIPVAALLANRLYLRFGIATVALALPAVYVGGFALWLVAFALPTAVGVRILQEVVQRGVTNSAWSAVFTVVPRARRGPVLAFMDAVPGHLGTVVSGLLLAVAASFTRSGVFVLGLAAGIACLAVCLGVRRRYGATVLATLREGLSEQVLDGGPGIAALTRDKRVVAGLVAACASPHATERRLAAEVLGTTAPDGAAPALVALLADEAADVRLAALDGLGRVGGYPRESVVPLLADPDPRVRRKVVSMLAADDPTTVARLAHDPDPGVRAEVAVAVAAAGSPADGASVLRRLLGGGDDERRAGLEALARTSLDLPGVDLAAMAAAGSIGVRAAAVRVLARVAQDAGPGAPVPGSPERSMSTVLTTSLDDDAPAVRAAAAAALRALPWGEDVALSALGSPSARCRTAALDALDGTVPTTRAALVTWAVAQVRRASLLRRDGRLLALAAQDPTPYLPASPRARSGSTAVGLPPTAPGAASAAFLATILQRRVDALVDQCLRVVALLGAAEATGSIRRALRSGDPEARAHAIEALDAVGAGPVARELVALLDSGEPDEASNTGSRIPAVARRHVDDDDPWVRALALRTLQDYLDHARRAVLQRAAGDPSAQVAAAFADVWRQEDLVPKTSPSPGVLDRMLLLRRVPLFAALEPEDLQRMASVTLERAYAGGEDLVREGDVGDELFVVAHGVVQVVRRDAGGERVIREIGEGEHVGELAVLRPGLRAATVRAGEPAVRVLVVGGEAVRAVLRERPEAALAMLATLADRIGRG